MMIRARCLVSGRICSHQRACRTPRRHSKYMRRRFTLQCRIGTSPSSWRTTPAHTTHNNDAIRSSHRRHGVNIVGYNATERQKEIIRTLIEEQTRQYRRPQDRKAQMTKQTRELGRLPAWPPNSPDLNLIEVVWSWMVKWMRQHDDGWPRDPETLKQRVLEAWDAVPLESFRELVRSYRVRLMAIHSVKGDRHPQFV